MSDTSSPRSEANRIGLNYREAPAPVVAAPIIDIHTHIHLGPQTALFFEAADAYGVGPVFSMSPLKDVDGLKERYSERLRFIAIPDWKRYDANEESREQ